jgi:ADP-heptose:LPS heptosyltransferase
MMWLELLLARDHIAAEGIQFSSIRRILVIRQHDQLGDFLLAIPALRALRGRFPNAEIAVLVREYFCDAARLIPYVNDVLVFHEDATRWRLRSIATFWRGLRSGWDLTVVLNTVSHSLTSDLLAWLSRARYVLGSGDRVFPGCKSNFFYNVLAPSDSTLKHQSERNLDIVRHIGANTDDLSELIIVPDAERQKALKDLKGRGLKSDGPVIGLHIGAGKPSNRWPVANFRILAERLNNTDSAQFVLFWGPAEDHLSDDFHRGLKFSSINIGYANLDRLAAYFSHCDVLVSNDTGTLHLASAVRVPVIAIFGPTDPLQWKPVGEHVVAVSAASGRVEDVGVDDVLTNIKDLLALMAKSLSNDAVFARHSA